MTVNESDVLISPENIWAYFEKHREELKKKSETVAQNDDFDVLICLGVENDLPILTVESSNVDSVEFIIEDKESCAETVTGVYELYLTDQIISVILDETDELELEDRIAEREADIDSFVRRFLEDLFEDEPILYSETMDDVVEDCKEHFLEYLYRKHKLSAYRPMELEDDEGVFVEDHPYECFEYEPCSLYDEKK